MVGSVERSILYCNKERRLYHNSADLMLWEKLMTTPSTQPAHMPLYSLATSHKTDKHKQETELPNPSDYFVDFQFSATQGDKAENCLKLNFHMKTMQDP